jgi:signal peptidase I, bacterial type
MQQKIKDICDFISDVCIMIGVVLLLQQYVFSVGQVFGKSMEPNLTESQKLIVDRVTYRFAEPHRFDIVAVKFPDADSYWVKRVIGLPGEKVEYIQGKLYVNGEMIEESFLKNNVFTKDFSTISFFPNSNGIIPDDNYLVLGDNRNNSMDGRIMGTLSKKDILGVARISIYPFDKIGFLTDEISKKGLFYE